MFVSYLAKEGLAHQSIKVYLSAVRNLHVSAGLHQEFATELTPRLQMVLRGIKKEKAKMNPPRTRLPITIDIMEKIKGALAQAPGDHNNILLWAACCLAFFGFLRASEFTVPSQTQYDPSVHLSFTDIALDSTQNASLMQVTIKQSKTDPFREGITLSLAATNKKVCPVLAMLPYLALRGGQPGLLFILADSTFLTRPKLAAMLRATLTQAGMDHTKYSTHSFRSGAATTAANVGISDVHIKLLGRWTSEAYQIYVKTPQDKLAPLAKKLASKSK